MIPAASSRWTRSRTAGADMPIRRAIAEGLTYRPLPLTAADTVAWFRTLPAERQARIHAGLSREREAELLAKLRA